RRSHRTSGRRGPRVHRLPTSRAGPAVASADPARWDHPVDDPSRWLLTAEERGNPATAVPGWTAGNLAEPLLHGSSDFARLVGAVRGRDAGDHLFCTDWRGDPDEKLTDDGPTVAALFTEAVARGVCVRGLVWRSHMDRLSLNKEANRSLDK